MVYLKYKTNNTSTTLKHPLNLLPYQSNYSGFTDQTINIYSCCKFRKVKFHPLMFIALRFKSIDPFLILNCSYTKITVFLFFNNFFLISHVNFENNHLHFMYMYTFLRKTSEGIWKIHER